MAKKIILKDIAEHANVSIATVSQVLSDSGRISEDTRLLVNKAIEELGYRQKIRKKPTTVAVLVSLDQRMSHLWYFLRGFIASLENNLQEKGYKTVLIPFHTYQNPKEIYEKLMEVNTSAIIVFHYGTQEMLSYFEKQGIQVFVIMDNHFEDHYATVGNDDFQGAYDAVNYLISLGHKKIAFVGEEQPLVLSTAKDRLYGFQKALEENGLEYHNEASISFSEKDTLVDVKRKIKERQVGKFVPTAYYCLHDILGFDMYQGAIQNGLSIPEAFSIIAAGDTLNYIATSNPQITTMRSQTDHMGVIASEMIQRNIEKGKDTINMVLKVKQKLVERGSCKRI